PSSPNPPLSVTVPPAVTDPPAATVSASPARSTTAPLVESTAAPAGTVRLSVAAAGTDSGTLREMFPVAVTPAAPTVIAPRLTSNTPPLPPLAENVPTAVWSGVPALPTPFPALAVSDAPATSVVPAGAPLMMPPEAVRVTAPVVLTTVGPAVASPRVRSAATAFTLIRPLAAWAWRTVSPPPVSRTSIDPVPVTVAVRVLASISSGLAPNDPLLVPIRTMALAITSGTLFTLALLIAPALDRRVAVAVPASTVLIATPPA